MIMIKTPVVCIPRHCSAFILGSFLPVLGWWLCCVVIDSVAAEAEVRGWVGGGSGLQWSPASPPSADCRPVRRPALPGHQGGHYRGGGPVTRPVTLCQCAAWGQREFGSPYQDVDLLVTESVLSVGLHRDTRAEQEQLYMTVAGQAGHSDRKHGHGYQHQHHTNT